MQSGRPIPLPDWSTSTASTLTTFSNNTNNLNNLNNSNKDKHSDPVLS